MRHGFFDVVRREFGPLEQAQVDGLNACLDAWSGTDPKFVAYGLATAWHETGRKMVPVQENLNYTTADRIKKVWPSRFKTVEAAKPFVRNPRGLANKVYGGRMGNTQTDDGWDYRGRGFVQITGHDNYQRAGGHINVDLVRRPDLALEQHIAAQIMVAGMLEGWFTGRKLSDYLVSGKFDAVGARAIINGQDMAKTIAGYYHIFLTALGKIGAAPLPPPRPDIPVPPPPDIPLMFVSEVAEPSWTRRVIAWLKGLRT
jgi:putative chitinase